MTDPLISVIIPTHNRLPTLIKAIESVIKQSYTHWELWVIDDGTDDNPSKWPSEFQNNPQIHYHKIEHQGVSRARNMGVALSKGDWIAFLDSDDEWLFQKLSQQMALAQSNPHYPLIHGEEIWIRKGVRVNQMKKHQKFGGSIFLKALPLCVISPSASMIKRTVFNELGGFREDYPVCEDYELWLRVTSKYEVGFIEEPIIKKFGGHEDQLSKRFVAMDYWRIKALYSISSSPDLNPLERQEVFKEIIKKSHILLKGYQKHQNFKNYAEIEHISASVLYGTL